MPIWANFVDPTDLSLPTSYHFRPNQFYKMDSTSTRPSQAAQVEAEVEVEAQSTRLIEISLILTFIMNTSLYRKTQLYIKANLIDLSDLV